MQTKPRTLPLNKRGLNFEMFMWIFTRISALAMYAIVLFAFFGALWMGARYHMNFADVMRWAFMPNVSHIQSTNVPDVAPWSTLFWKLVAMLLVLVATAHGVHGLVVIADDYIVKPLGRKIVRFLSIVMMVSVSIMGLYVIWIS
jgi:succinate dehydrogenase hydrophobic anchor subunit